MDLGEVRCPMVFSAWKSFIWLFSPALIIYSVANALHWVWMVSFSSNLSVHSFICTVVPATTAFSWSLLSDIPLHKALCIKAGDDNVEKSAAWKSQSRLDVSGESDGDGIICILLFCSLLCRCSIFSWVHICRRRRESRLNVLVVNSEHIFGIADLTAPCCVVTSLWQ